MPDTDNTTILASIKDSLDIPESVTAFDATLLMHINAQMSRLYTLGMPPETNPTMIGPDTLWSDYFNDSEELNLVKLIIYLRVRLAFDPPTSSFVLNALEETAKETEWRLNVLVDSNL